MCMHPNYGIRIRTPNLSFSKGIFPDKLKMARVVPIFKKGDKSIPGNYRPISILPIISKLFEKLVNNRIVNFLERNENTV